MINDAIIRNLRDKLNFSESSIEKLHVFHKDLLNYNQKYNLISKSTENDVWNRHILDSAQLVKFINFTEEKSLADLGTGGGFPGLVLAIYNSNEKFHVKLYEKSNVKCDFLRKMIEKLNVKAEVINEKVGSYQIDSDYIICRAFKKFSNLLNISREIGKKPHKLIVLKGKSAQDEINIALKEQKFEYSLEKSMTDINSKIIIISTK